MGVCFRDYLERLREQNELLEISRPVDLRNIAALVPQSEKALFFTKPLGYSIPVVSGLLQSRNRLALGNHDGSRDHGPTVQGRKDRHGKPIEVHLIFFQHYLFYRTISNCIGWLHPSGMISPSRTISASAMQGTGMVTPEASSSGSPRRPPA